MSASLAVVDYNASIDEEVGAEVEGGDGEERPQKRRKLGEDDTPMNADVEMEAMDVDAVEEDGSDVYVVLNEVPSEAEEEEEDEDTSEYTSVQEVRAEEEEGEGC